MGFEFNTYRIGNQFGLYDWWAGMASFLTEERRSIL
jgi:hypothetical protein